MPNAEKLDRVIADTIRFFAEVREPHALLWLAVMHRRFRINAFARALRTYDEVLATKPEDLPLLRVFRRIADDDTPVRLEDLEAVTHSSDRIIVSALYCDRLGLPRSFPEVLDKASRAGGYYLTHALLAWIWIRDRGCGLPLRDGFVDELLRANAAIIGGDPTTVTELKLEAAAFLHLAGHGTLVDDTFVENVIASQNQDGGWGRSRDGRGGSDWHASILALLLLLHVKLADACRGSQPAEPRSA